MHLAMVYCANIPFLVGLIFSFFGVYLNETLKFLSLCYITSIINWVCGYHWNLSMQSLERRTLFATLSFNLLSLWALYVAFCKDYLGSAYILTGILSIQLYWDFQSEVTYFISPNMKIARIISTIFMIYFLSRVFPL